MTLGQKFVPNHLGLSSGITMGLAGSFGGVVSPFLGKIADGAGVERVLWILIGMAAVAGAASYFVPDAKKPPRAGGRRKRGAPLSGERPQGLCAPLQSGGACDILEKRALCAVLLHWRRTSGKKEMLS